jgi:hypothetical protein
LNNKEIIFGMISRIGWKRSGTRFNTRGADKDGYVANFVESEQVLISKKKILIKDENNLLSYRIIRGSIPLLWTQFANYR